MQIKGQQSEKSDSLPEIPEVVRQYATIVRFPKGTIIVKEGERDDTLYVIEEGIWQAYINHDGEDITMWFAVPGEAVFSSWGYYQKAPSRYSIKTSCDSVALRIEKETIDTVFHENPELSRWLFSLYTRNLMNWEDLLVDINKPFASQRYLSLLKKMPEIIEHVPLKEIAGYVGVTPQSLSRIRNRLIQTDKKNNKIDTKSHKKG